MKMSFSCAAHFLALAAPSQNMQKIIAQGPKKRVTIHLPSNEIESDRRKRKCTPNQDTWKRYKAKKQREAGLQYVGYRILPGGKTVIQDCIRPARELGPTCTSRECVRVKSRHCSLISETDRKEIFAKLWSDTNWDQRKKFVTNHVKTIATKRIYTSSSSSRRSSTNQYFLTVGKEQLQVCKSMFLNTTGLKESQVLSWVRQSDCCMSTSILTNNKQEKNQSKPVF